MTAKDRPSCCKRKHAEMALSARQRHVASSDRTESVSSPSRRRVHPVRKHYAPIRNGPSFLVTDWTRKNVVKLSAGILMLGAICITPLYFLEKIARSSVAQQHRRLPLDGLFQKSHYIRNDLSHKFNVGFLRQGRPAAQIKTIPRGMTWAPKNITLPDLDLLSDEVLIKNLPLARGVAGRPIEQTPALVGARRGHIECDVNVDSLAYWNDPQGDRDVQFSSPFEVQGDTKYITFTPDRGGWNNIRMSMEVIFVIAAATGRTLVLPPEEPLYLLTGDKKDQYRGFGDFFPLQTEVFQKRLKVISTEEFIRREGGSDGRLPLPEANKTKILNAVKHCQFRAKSEDSCFPLWEHLERVGYVPSIASDLMIPVCSCVVFDEDVFHGDELTPEHQANVTRFCQDRKVTFWTQEMQDPILLHFKTKDLNNRLLVHFYGLIHFTNPALDHHFKRFVRDYLHYNDRIYCAAGKIVKALQLEGQSRGFPRDATGMGGFSAWHVRRGDFQYKVVKLSAEDWYNNTKELYEPNEILYIATDERNKSFFDPVAKYHTLRFLDDYWQLGNLSQLDPNFMGMIDTIVASRARVFVGTWFSTFSGYINRMRGYHGLTMNNSWYSWLPRKDAVHKWGGEDNRKYGFEWPTGFQGIDADIWPSKDVF